MKFRIIQNQDGTYTVQKDYGVIFNDWDSRSVYPEDFAEDDIGENLIYTCKSIQTAKNYIARQIRQEKEEREQARYKKNPKVIEIIKG